MSTNRLNRHTGLIHAPAARKRVVTGTRMMLAHRARPSVDYTTGMTFDGSLDLGNAGPGGIGDCVPVASLQLARIRQRAVFHSDWTPTTAMARSLYAAWAGYDGTPATDNGTDVTHALDMWAQNGIHIGAQLLDIGAWMAIDPSDLDLVRSAIDPGTGALFSMAIRESDFDVTQPWDATTAPSIGGHQIVCARYDAAGFYPTSWDYEITLTNAGAAQRLVSVQVPVSRDLFQATGLSLDGFSYDDLLAELRA